jgi:Secretion system C-terminal sorting domain
MMYFTCIKKCWPVLLLMFCCSIHAFSQRYDFAASSGTFTPLVGGVAVDAIEFDDALSGTLPIGFTFNYFGTNYTQFKVSSNGFITFDVASTSSSNTNEIQFSFDTERIAPLWDDLDGAAGTASYLVSGSAPSRVLMIEWLNWQWDFQATAAGISFQVKLYESTHAISPNKIEFVYRPEAGALNSADASIGLIGNASDQFYSLTNSSTSPVNSPIGVDNISTKPASGQVYTFTPNAAVFVAPTVQATNITTPSLGSVTSNLAWTNGNGQYRAVFMKQTTSTSETVPLTNNTFYAPSTTFGNNQVGASGWYCVYNGLGNTSSVANLQSGLPYRIQVVEYNGVAGIQKYNLTASTNNPVNVTTVLVAPVAPISTLDIVYRTSTKVTFNLIEGNGTRRAIFMKAASSGTSAPVDNTTYTANTIFGSGTQIGATGWFCVFDGTSTTSVTVTGLSGSTSYRIHAVDYNGLAGSERYFASSAVNNPVQFTTFVSIPVPTYTFAATSGAFTAITGANAVDAIETDDALSAIIPIGFTFYHGGIPFTDLKASSNGFLTFNTFETSSNIQNDLTGSLARSVVAPLWDDMSGSGGSASYVITGTAPNRIFIFEWLNWRWDFSASAGISFQAKLHESDNKVEYVYRQEGGALASSDASIGMAFPEFGSGGFISLNNSTAGPAASTTVETTTIATKPATGQVYSFAPQKFNQTITFGSLVAKTFGDLTFNLTATSTSGLPISYMSSNTTVATISGNTVTIVGAGTSTITASQTGDVNYNAATPVPQVLTVNPANQIITFGALANKQFGNANFALGATTSSSLTISYASSNTAVATISGNTVTIVGVGTTNITASQAGNTNYNAASNVMRSFIVDKGDQTITFGTFPPKTVGDANFLLTASASSGLAVSYSSSNTSVATVTGSNVTILALGSTTITAMQAGNANYNAATSVPQVLAIKQAQTISFPALAAKTLSDPAFDLTATSSSGLLVSYVSSNTAVATINGATVTLLGAGTTTITASQIGNSSFNPAAPVDQILTVSKIDQTITFPAIPDKTMGDASFSLTATASSSLPVSFSTISSRISITGSQVSLLSAGSVTVAASQTGSASYNAALAVLRTFCIFPAKPTISSSALNTETPVLTSSALAGNQWYKDDVAISGATNTTLTVTQPGVYTVIATIDNCSSVVSAGEAMVITGDKDKVVSAITVHPNPVENELWITLPSSQSASVSVVDMLGRTVGKASGHSTIRMDMRGFTTGSYIVLVQTEKELLSKRINKK